MLPPVELISDIWDLIIDVLGNGLDSKVDFPALRNLALTCKAMVSPCRKHLFSTINLTDATWISLFYRLVIHTPEIVHYIRHVEHHIVFAQDVRVHWIFEILGKSTMLRSVKLRGGHRRCQWGTLPESSQNALARLIRLPSVTTVDLTSIDAIPSSIFSGSTNLTHLTLTYVRFTHHNELEVDGAQHDVSEPPRLKYFRMIFHSPSDLTPLVYPDQKVIDFSGLRVLICEVASSECMEVIWQVLKFTRRLESLSVIAYSTRNKAVSCVGLGACLSAWNVGALKELNLSLEVIPDYDPLYDLVRELGMIAGMNIIKEVRLEVNFYTNMRPRGSTGIWSALDTLLTRPGSFPMLNVVTVKILWDRAYWNPEPETSFLDPLTEEKFPRLLDSKVMEFAFSCKRL